MELIQMSFSPGDSYQRKLIFFSCKTASTTFENDEWCNILSSAWSTLVRFLQCWQPGLGECTSLKNKTQNPSQIASLTPPIKTFWIFGQITPPIKTFWIFGQIKYFYSTGKTLHTAMGSPVTFNCFASLWIHCLTLAGRIQSLRREGRSK